MEESKTPTIDLTWVIAGIVIGGALLWFTSKKQPDCPDCVAPDPTPVKPSPSPAPKPPAPQPH